MSQRGVPGSAPITHLLHQHKGGDAAAFEQLIEIVYPHLVRVARGQLARQPSEATLDATSLVNEAYLQLVKETGVEWQSREHFYAIAARTMRRILVDQARRRLAGKRGGGRVAVTLDPEVVSIGTNAEVVLAVDRAVDELKSFNERLATVVECRYFAGLSAEETASTLEVSSRTVERDWLRARAWLADKLAS